MNEHTAFICMEIWADERTGDLQKMSTSNFYDLRKFSCLYLVSKNNSGFSVTSSLYLKHTNSRGSHEGRLLIKSVFCPERGVQQPSPASYRQLVLQ